jgi:hypothetical protein
MYSYLCSFQNNLFNAGSSDRVLTLDISSHLNLDSSRGLLHFYTPHQPLQPAQPTLSQYLQAVFQNEATTTTTTTMKFSIVLFALLATAPTYVQAGLFRGNSVKATTDVQEDSVEATADVNDASASVKVGPLETCGMQALCLDFTIELLGIGLNACNLVEQVVDIVSNPLSTIANTVGRAKNLDLDFKICMKLQLGGSCAKGTSDTVSHTCEKEETNDECSDGFGFGLANELIGIPDGYESCQTVKGGGTAEFLIQDGDGVCGSTSMSFNTDGKQTQATCGALESLYENGSCTENKNKGCVWTIQAPTSSDGFDVVGDTTPKQEEPVANDEPTEAEEQAYLC